MAKEILAGAVLALHKQGDLDTTMAELGVTALRVKAERDEAVRLLRRTLEMREMGSHGVHKTAIRDFLALIGEPAEGRSATRMDRIEVICNAIAALQPRAEEAIDLLLSLHRGVEDRYGKGQTTDLKACINDVEEALSEIEV